jgi:hypothetical protein
VRRVAIACGVSLVAVAAAAVSGTGVARARPPTWSQVAAGLTARLDPGSANPCQRGDLSCFDVVLGEMRRREQVLSSACGHSALWADLYRQMTEQIGAAARGGLFRNPGRLAHFDAWFARLYFGALDDWQARRTAAVPPAWQVALRAADRRSARGIGDLLLGLNAHVTRDLAYAAADVFTGSQLAIDPDFLLVNRIIERLSDSALNRVADRFDPTVSLARLPIALRAGRRTFGGLVALWRAEAWRNGRALRLAAPAERPAVERRIETRATLRAGAILAGTRYLPVVQSSRQRDAYCASHPKSKRSGVDLSQLCGLSARCTNLVTRWTRVEGLGERAIVGARAFYLNGCLGCHLYLGDGKQRLSAPDLTAEGKRNRGIEWQLRLLRCPTCVLVGVPMPPLPFIRARDVAIFLEASKGARKA